MAGSRDRERTRDSRDRHRDDRHGSHGSNGSSRGYGRHSRRSPDSYRSDYNSDDNNYDNNRRHRTQEYDRYDFDRSRNHRERRDRSRSRDRDRDSASTIGTDNQSIRYYNEDHNSSNNGFNNESNERERYHQRDRREEVPNNTLMIRGLATHIAEKDIVTKLAEHNLMAKDIRLMRKKETGVSRGFAFVEFINIEDAIQWKELTQGYIYFDEECEASVHYSIPKETFGGDKTIMKNDWTCYKCGVNNFKRREECFKCGTPKEESMANDTGDEISLNPTNALLLRNLSPNTTEERILTILGSLTALPIKSIRILKDGLYNISRGMCLVELHTTLEASQLFTLLSSLNLGFIIDDSLVQVNYGKRNVTFGQTMNCNPNAAIIALAAAQWRNLDEDNLDLNTNTKQTQSKTISTTQLSTSKTKGNECLKYETPDVSTFVLDETSGYYYDATTGFYYDANTQYYYNSQTQQYMYWEATNQTYLSVDSKTWKINEEKKEIPKETKVDKVKIAKKIAKDMEKWAKTLNQKKDTSRALVTNDSQMIGECSQSLSADAGYAVLEQEVTANESENILSFEMQKQFDDKSSVYLSACKIIKTEEKRLIDWEKLACLLCKRQFNTTDLLNKHLEKSDLHKSNLNALKHQLLTEEQIEEMEKNERESGYRDRAKERRKKYGLPETPDSSKLKNKYMNERDGKVDTFQSVSHQKTKAISCDNIGNKMLKAMGWTEGTGLGRVNQGMHNIIEVERRAEGAGLGSGAKVTALPGESYKDAVKRTMYQRYKEMD
ncbi:RNA-binding protein 5-like isoform X2 [Oppia nitens]|nr:RNA-binding protein 5-like isoform X2 [Oppia nitens]XP_054168568.1 RNA-binding protein 5-like isoform X2 [Oppia nitens]XP_054168569.1 RNA-binding protein 5-like isoform X2 [Oppia nitens]